MAYEVNHKTLAAELAMAIQYGETVLISGAPGIGKTEAVAAACILSGRKLIMMRPEIKEAPDFAGFLFNGNLVLVGDAREAVAACQQAVAAGEPMPVIFLDEIDKASQPVQRALLHLLLPGADGLRHIGPETLPAGVPVVAAGNRPEDGSGGEMLASTVLSRAACYSLTVSPRETAGYLHKTGAPKLLVAFLLQNPGYVAVDAATMKQAVRARQAFPCPRAWATFAQRWNRRAAAGASEADCIVNAAAYVGPVCAAALAGFASVWGELPTLAQIIADPKGAKLPVSPAGQVASYVLCADVEIPSDLKAVTKYMMRISVEYAYATLSLACGRTPALHPTWLEIGKEIPALTPVVDGSI